MSASILVSYATRYGSTQEVAEAVAEVVRDSGLEVDLQPMQKVRTLDGTHAVVLGAPIYFGQWHKEAHSFLARHQAALAEKPVAIFALGPLHADEKEIQGSRAQLDQALAQHPWLRPVALEMFGGKYNPARLNVPDRLIASLPASPLHGQLAVDQRDWTAIRAWAVSLAAQLQSVNG